MKNFDKKKKKKEIWKDQLDAIHYKINILILFIYL